MGLLGDWGSFFLRTRQPRQTVPSTPRGGGGTYSWTDVETGTFIRSKRGPACRGFSGGFGGQHSVETGEVGRRAGPESPAKTRVRNGFFWWAGVTDRVRGWISGGEQPHRLMWTEHFRFATKPAMAKRTACAGGPFFFRAGDLCPPHHATTSRPGSAASVRSQRNVFGRTKNADRTHFTFSAFTRNRVFRSWLKKTPARLTANTK